jgi:capsular polysaccharide biosynthesis protein
LRDDDAEPTRGAREQVRNELARDRRPATSRFSGVLTWVPFALAAAVLGAGVGFSVVTLLPPKFSAQATLLVSPSSASASVGDLDLALRVTPNFAELAKTDLILQRVIDELSLPLRTDQLGRDVSTQVPAQTSLITITANHDDAATSADIANAIGEQLIAFPGGGGSIGTSQSRVVLTLVDPAAPPSQRAGLGTIGTTALSAGLGVLAAVSIAFLIENLRKESVTALPIRRGRRASDQPVRS